MNIENIISVFSRLSGIDQESSVTLRFICENTFNYILSHLKPDADICRCSSKLEYAAAALAYYRYILWHDTENGENITVGDISVKSSADRLEKAYTIYRQAVSDISDIFDDGGFVFEGV